MSILILARHPEQADCLLSAASTLDREIDLLPLIPAFEKFQSLSGIRQLLQVRKQPESIAGWASALAPVIADYQYVLSAADRHGQDLLAMLGALTQRPVCNQVCAFDTEGAAQHYSHAGAFVVSEKNDGGLYAIQTGAFAPRARTTSHPKVTELALATFTEKQRLIHFTASTEKNLENAPIVLGGGKGLGQDFEALLNPLAQVLDAQIGGTRSVVEAGLLDQTRQIGQTGRHIAPKLYLAAGISGAAQHVAGIRNSKIIIAINHDPEAPIFKVADYGLLAEAQDALPALVRSLTAMKN